ncbi:hypothetical protein [[Clostridium] colinum]|uniref:hypothetical protein n=1 Tax=[Clostridium] colinum TaxID=36835 RepID=UPI002023EDD3|nr:hypothetical protein [[Clostridium] colinum]
MDKIEKEEIIPNIKEYINKVNNEIENIINEIRNNNNIDNLLNMLEGISYCIKGLVIINDSFSIIEDNLKSQLEEILEGVENGDFNLVADIVEYEIVEIVQDLNENLEKL